MVYTYLETVFMIDKFNQEFCNGKEISYLSNQ